MYHGCMPYSRKVYAIFCHTVAADQSKTTGINKTGGSGRGEGEGDPQMTPIEFAGYAMTEPTERDGDICRYRSGMLRTMKPAKEPTYSMGFPCRACLGACFDASWRLCKGFAHFCS